MRFARKGHSTSLVSVLLDLDADILKMHFYIYIEAPDVWPYFLFFQVMIYIGILKSPTDLAPVGDFNFPM